MIATCLECNKEVITQLLRKVLILLEIAWMSMQYLPIIWNGFKILRKKKNPNPHIQVTWGEYELS